MKKINYILWLNILLLLCIYANILSFFYISKYTFHINVYSCNRHYYFNRTIQSIITHLMMYRKTFKYFIIWYDQGTIYRYLFMNKYNLVNNFFLSPEGYSYSFGLSFSYNPTKFVLILEEDWVIEKSIYAQLKYKEFISLSINILSQHGYISGIILRDFPYSKLKRETINEHTKEMDIYILEEPFNNLAYINGPSIYATQILSLLPQYNDETSAGKWFYHNGFRLAIFNNSGRLITGGKITENIFIHIGINRTRNGLCSIFLY